MKRCQYCGELYPDNLNVCPKCGALKKTAAKKTTIIIPILLTVLVLGIWGGTFLLRSSAKNRDNISQQSSASIGESTDMASAQTQNDSMEESQTVEGIQPNNTTRGEVMSLETIEPIFEGDSSIWTEVDMDFDGYLNIYPRFNLDVAISKYPGWFGTFYLGSRQNASHAYGLYTLALQGFVAEGDYQITHIKTDNSNNAVIGVADIFLHVDSSGCSISDVESSDTGYRDSSSIIWTDYNVRVEQVGSEILLHYRSNDSTFLIMTSTRSLQQTGFIVKTI